MTRRDKAKQSLVDELLHAARAFQFTEHNSRVLTGSLWAALGLWSVGVFGLVTGLYVPDTRVMITLTGVVTFLFARAQERERQHLDQSEEGS